MKAKRKRKKSNIKVYVNICVLFLLLIALIFTLVIVFRDKNKNVFTNIKEMETENITLEVEKFYIEPLENKKLEIIDNSSTIDLSKELTAEGIFLYDLTRKEIVYSKNPQKKMAPASLTKIMTAIIVLENEKDISNTILTYKDYMGEEILEYGYTLEEIAAYEYKDGETMSVKDALYMLMIRSTNDTANLLGEHYGDGDLNKFIEMMNHKARELGAFDTNFSNTHGLDHKNLYTTPYDMFLIMHHALKLDGFLEIIGTLNYSLDANNFYEPREITNVLGILNPEYPQYFYPYILGAKSGYTDEAGRCLISASKRSGKEYLLVLMGVPLTDETGDKIPASLFFSETHLLYEWVFNGKK